MFYNRGEVLSDQFDHFKFNNFVLSLISVPVSPVSPIIPVSLPSPVSQV